MRLTGLALGSTLIPALFLGLAAAPPAEAQRYRYADPCQAVQADHQAAGAVLGGVIGGLAGNGLAAPKNRAEGSVLGALFGAVAGSAIAGDSSRCSYAVRAPDPAPYPSPYPGPRSYGRDYGYRGGPDGDVLAGGPGDAYPDSYPEDPRYADGDRDRGYPDDRQLNSSGDGHRRLADDDDTDMTNPDSELRECKPVTQRTALPDGTEQKRVVRACRYARYGDWIIED